MNEFKIKNGQKSYGFTIVELLIASAVFSIVLIGALTGFLQIGRVFYKGTSLATTQETAKQVLNDVADSVQTAAAVSPALSDAPYNYYCIGSVRYTYKIGRAVDTSHTDSFSRSDRYGLVKDNLPSSDACAPPCPVAPAPCTANQTRWTSPVELLGDNMRLQEFKLQPNPSVSVDYYTISVVVAFGDDDLLELATSGDEASIRCKGTSSQGQHFCAVAKYSTSLKRGMNI